MIHKCLECGTELIYSQITGKFETKGLPQNKIYMGYWLCPKCDENKTSYAYMEVNGKLYKFTDSDDGLYAVWRLVSGSKGFVFR